MPYTPSTTGKPCWYELGTTDLDAATTFYESVLGWNVQKTPMPDMDYRLANDSDGHGCAGMMSLADQQDAPPPNWLFYLEVGDADAVAQQITSLGGSVVQAPADIPGTGRFAVVTDPQGAFFGILQPQPMDEAPEVSAFDQSRTAHGNWHELATTDPEAAFGFYSEIFGWAKGEAMDMGADGTYQIFSGAGTDLGGIMGMMMAPRPGWLSYFGVTGVEGAIARATDGGGSVVHGPNEVPGGAWVAIIADPQGAVFGITGPQR